MAKYKVTSNFVIDKTQYDKNTVVEISKAAADKINKRGAKSHPTLAPFLVLVEEKKVNN